jgi:hypothetical protein
MEQQRNGKNTMHNKFFLSVLYRKKGMKVILHVAFIAPLIRSLGEWIQGTHTSPDIYMRASLKLSLKDKCDPELLLATFLLESTKLLFGIYGNTLLGNAYRAYQWTEDEEYNAKRKADLLDGFMTHIKSCTFLRKESNDQCIFFVALRPSIARHWGELIQIVVLKSQTFKNPVSFEAIGKIHQIKKPVESATLVSAFRKWFLKNKHFE